MDQKASNKRPKTQTNGKIRNFDIKMGVVTSASGSCLISLGNTRIQCCVNAPKISTKKSSNDTSQLNIEVTDIKNIESEGSHNYMIACLVEAFDRIVALKEYPHQMFEIWIQIEEDDGGLYSVALMGLAMAFIDAGIQIIDLISACTVYGYCDTNGEMHTCIDLNANELQRFLEIDKNLTVLTMAYNTNLNTLAYLKCIGKYTDHNTQLQLMLSTAQAACEVIGTELINILKNLHHARSQSTGFIQMQDESICPEMFRNRNVK